MLKNIFLILIIVSSFISCKNNNYRSFDFTKDELFTHGIEGPTVDSKGNLYAVNFAEEGSIGIVDKHGNPSFFTKLPNGSIGNGIRFNNNDDMFIADYTNHAILIIKNGTTKAIIYAQDSTMSQPNDLAISSNGTLYASDPNWENETGNIWMISHGECILLEENMGTTNGIEVGPNSKKLYVNESVQRKIWVYDIQADGNIKNKKLFASFNDFGLDGMRCDNKGNLYVCRYDKGTVIILSPQGETIKEVQLKGKKPSNITFGGVDHKQCFVTMADRGCFESFYSEFSGK